MGASTTIFHNFCTSLPVSRRVVKLRLPTDLECVKFHYRLLITIYGNVEKVMESGDVLSLARDQCFIISAGHMSTHETHVL